MEKVISSNAIRGSMYLYSMINPDLRKSRLHKQVRETSIHEMLQHYLNEVADNTDGNRKQNRLIGKYFAESKYPLKKVCSCCGYKKNAEGK